MIIEQEQKRLEMLIVHYYDYMIQYYDTDHFDDDLQCNHIHQHNNKRNKQLSQSYQRIYDVIVREFPEYIIKKEPSTNLLARRQPQQRMKATITSPNTTTSSLSYPELYYRYMRSGNYYYCPQCHHKEQSLSLSLPNVSLLQQQEPHDNNNNKSENPRITKQKSFTFQFDRYPATFHHRYELLQQYYHHYGHCHITIPNEDEEDYEIYSTLCEWMMRIRLMYRRKIILGHNVGNNLPLKSNRSYVLTPDRIQLLQNIKFDFTTQYHQLYYQYDHHQQNTSTADVPNSNQPPAAVTPFRKLNPSDTPAETYDNEKGNDARATDSIPNINRRSARIASSSAPKIDHHYATTSSSKSIPNTNHPTIATTSFLQINPMPAETYDNEKGNDVRATTDTMESIPNINRRSTRIASSVPKLDHHDTITTIESIPNINQPPVTTTPFPQINPLNTPVETYDNEKGNDVRATIPIINRRSTRIASSVPKLDPTIESIPNTNQPPATMTPFVKINPSDPTVETYRNDEGNDVCATESIPIINRRSARIASSSVPKIHHHDATTTTESIENRNQPPVVTTPFPKINSLDMPVETLHIDKGNDNGATTGTTEPIPKINRRSTRIASSVPKINHHDASTTTESIPNSNHPPAATTPFLKINPSDPTVEMHHIDNGNDDIRATTSTTESIPKIKTFHDELQRWNADQKIKDIFYHIYQSRCKDHVRYLPELLRIALVEYGIHIEQYNVETNIRKGSYAYKTIKQAHEQSNVLKEDIRNMLRGKNEIRKTNISWRFIQVEEGKRKKRYASNKSSAANVSKKMRVMVSSGNDSNEDSFYHELQKWNANQEVKDLLYQIYQAKEKNIQQMFKAAYKYHRIRLQQYHVKTNAMIGRPYQNIKEAYILSENNKENIKFLLRGETKKLPFPNCYDPQYSWRLILLKDDDDEGLPTLPEEINR